jgi:hypothetical protein
MFGERGREFLISESSIVQLESEGSNFNRQDLESPRDGDGNTH